MTASNGFSNTYDFEGRIPSETFSSGKIVNYTYDSRGLPSAMSDWVTGSTSFSYDTADRFTGMTRANGTGRDYAYDAADRLISAVEKQPGPISTPPLSSIVLTRDALGRPTSIDRRQPLMPGATMPASSSFGYDIASQMNGVSHDALGRTTVDGARALGWNGPGHLTTYASSADTLDYSDDSFNNPKKIEPHNGGVIQLAWGFGRGYPTNDDMAVTLPSRYRLNVRAPSGLMLYGVDGASGARSFYHYDERGNTAFLTNDGGHVTTEYAYGPFGGVSALGQTTDNLFTFGATRGMLALASNGVSTGLWHDGGEVYDERTMRVVSGLATASGPQPHLVGPGPIQSQPGPVQSQPGPISIGDPNTIGDPNISVALNPQPFPPAPGDGVALNPQPFPPAPGTQPGPTQTGWKTPGPSQTGWSQPGPSQNGWTQPGPVQTQPGPISIGWTNPGPISSGWSNPGPTQTQPGPIQTQPGPTQTGWSQPGPTQTGWSNPGPQQTGWKNPGPIGTGFTTKSVDAFIWFGPEESIVFVYGKIGVAYTHQKPDADNDWSFGVENPTTIGSATGGAGAGKSNFDEFQIGPGGDEIHADKYGRVKVKFFWDRNGKKADNSSGSSAPCLWCPR